MAAAERRGRIWQGDPSAALSLLSASAVVSVAAAFFFAWPMDCILFPSTEFGWVTKVELGS